MPEFLLSSLHSSKICIFVIGMTKQGDWVLKPVLYIAYRFESGLNMKIILIFNDSTLY